jgi:hypothetical protein
MNGSTAGGGRRGLTAGEGGWNEQPRAGGPDGGPFANGGECRSEGQVLPLSSGRNQTHDEDWRGAKKNTAWLRDPSGAGAAAAQPFYLYQGMSIVHPPYVITQYWYLRTTWRCPSGRRWIRCTRARCRTRC